MLFILIAFLFVSIVAAFSPIAHRVHLKSSLKMQGDGLKINFKGKTIFVAGVADSTGYGWAIAKAAAEAGAKVILGTWPPVLPVFQMGIDRGQFVEDSKLSDGSNLDIAKVCVLLFSRYLVIKSYVIIDLSIRCNI